MANTYLTRTFGSSPSTTLFTWSAWVKRGKLGTQQAMISGCSSHGANTGQLIYFTNDDRLAYYAQASGTVKCNLKTNAQFRDTNAWYHIVLKVDSSQSNVANRVVFYVNNVERSYITTVEHTQNWDAYFMLTTPTDVGRNGMNTSDYFDGVMSHMHMTHGYNYTPSTFGSVDATTGEWKINTSPTVNYNSNGFFILKDGNTGTDHSGNSETFSSGGGTVTKTEDCPSNVFATLNPLDNQNQGSTLTVGNNKIEWNTDNKNNFTTLAMNAGKYYWEMKYVITTGGQNAMIGVSKLDTRQGDSYAGHDGNSWSYYSNSGQKYHNGSGTSYGNSWGTDNIIGVAFDTNTRTIWFSKDGVWQNSATISEIAAGTTTNSAYTGIGTAGEFFIPCMSGYDGNKAAFNFGNGYFSTTAVSSAGTNASGNGIFEYDVPTGYTALSTKGLNL